MQRGKSRPKRLLARSLARSHSAPLSRLPSWTRTPRLWLLVCAASSRSLRHKTNNPINKWPRRATVWAKELACRAGKMSSFSLSHAGELGASV